MFSQESPSQSGQFLFSTGCIDTEVIEVDIYESTACCFRRRRFPLLPWKLISRSFDYFMAPANLHSWKISPNFDSIFDDKVGIFQPAMPANLMPGNCRCDARFRPVTWQRCAACCECASATTWDMLKFGRFQSGESSKVQKINKCIIDSYWFYVLYNVLMMDPGVSIISMQHFVFAAIFHNTSVSWMVRSIRNHRKKEALPWQQKRGRQQEKVENWAFST